MKRQIFRYGFADANSRINDAVSGMLMQNAMHENADTLHFDGEEGQS